MNKTAFSFIILLSLGVFTSCNTETNSPEEAVRTVNVETEIVEPGVFQSFLQQVGTVTTNNDVQVAAEVSGRIVDLRKEEGDQVAAGETVIKVDDRKLTQELRRLEANTEQSRENYERLKRLYEEQNIGSEIDYLNAKFLYEQNLAALESVRIDLENTSITAPFSGTIESIDAEEGELVSPGTPVFRLIGRNGKKIRLGVPARYSGAVTVGDTVEVWFDFDQTRHRLPITFVGNSIDPMNRTFTVDILLSEELSNVKVDMIANVRLRTEYQEDVLVIGEQYIFQKDDGSVVYILEENPEGNPIASQRMVETGASFGNNVVIERGLSPGDELITIGSSYVQDSTRVQKVGMLQEEMAETLESDTE